MTAIEEFESVLIEYRKSRRTIIGHAIFMAACIALVVLVRRVFGLPPQMLATVLIVALLVFGWDIMNFMRLRSRVAELREQLESS